MSSQSEVFLSYSADTRLQAEQLLEVLRQQGIHAWAAKDLEPGQTLKQEVEKALDQAQTCLVMVGAKSQADSWLRWEWRTVLEKVWTDSTKRMVPLIVGKNEVPVWLRSWAAVKIDPKSDVASWSGDVLEAIRNGHKNGVRVLSAQDRQTRKLRFSEIASAAQELKRFEANETLPAVEPSA